MVRRTRRNDGLSDAEMIVGLTVAGVVVWLAYEAYQGGQSVGAYIQQQIQALEAKLASLNPLGSTSATVYPEETLSPTP